MKSPWWHLRRQPSGGATETPPDDTVPKRRVVTRRDRDGDPVEHAWVSEDAWLDYDDTRWRPDWR